MDLRLLGFPELYLCDCLGNGTKHSLQPVLKGKSGDINTCGCKCHSNINETVRYVQEIR